jgi:hypothetical protein
MPAISAAPKVTASSSWSRLTRNHEPEFGVKLFIFGRPKPLGTLKELSFGASGDAIFDINDGPPEKIVSQISAKCLFCERSFYLSREFRPNTLVKPLKPLLTP